MYLQKRHSPYYITDQWSVTTVQILFYYTTATEEEEKKNFNAQPAALPRRTVQCNMI